MTVADPNHLIAGRSEDWPAAVAHFRCEHAANKISEQTLLREELNAALGQLRLDIAKSSLETARANLLSSLGLDPRVDGLTAASSIGEIAGSLRRGGALPAGTSQQIAVAGTKGS